MLGRIFIAKIAGELLKTHLRPHFEMDSLDNTFMAYLKELERTYLYLEKHIRLRVEKWIERLALASSNTVWRKHRNNYIRLLLGMVIKRDVQYPFDKSPPDGNIPPFPAHLKALLKGIQGPHESVFWRDLYARLPFQQDDLNIKDKNEGTKRPLRTISSGGNALEITRGGRRRNSDDGDGFKSWSEVLEETAAGASTTLKSLLHEQSSRIGYLETQLHSERVRHKLNQSRAAHLPRGSSMRNSFDASLLSTSSSAFVGGGGEGGGPHGSVLADLDANTSSSFSGYNTQAARQPPASSAGHDDHHHRQHHPHHQQQQHKETIEGSTFYDDTNTSPAMVASSHSQSLSRDEDFLEFLEGFQNNLQGLVDA